MPIMLQSRRQVERLPLPALCFILLVGSLLAGLGCARQQPSQTGGIDLASTQLPFHSASNLAFQSTIESADSALAPFQSDPRSRILPAGTLLTVELEDSLSSANFHAGASFLASVAEPFVIAGHTVVDRGTQVIGQIESAEAGPANRTANQSQGYFRLSLTSLVIGGRHIALQTSSLFTRGKMIALGVHPAAMRVNKGRSLTFRLTAASSIPILAGDHDSVARR